MNTMNRIIILSILVICSGCSFNPEKYIDDLEDFVRFETAFDVAGSQKPVNAYIISTSSEVSPRFKAMSKPPHSPVYPILKLCIV